jgi:hypothetical protein
VAEASRCHPNQELALARAIKLNVNDLPLAWLFQQDGGFGFHLVWEAFPN